MSILALMERDILMWIQENLRVAALTPVMKLFSLLGDKGLFWIALTLLLLAFRRTRRVGAYCAVSMVLTFLVVNCAVKPLVARVRPYDLFPEIQLLVRAEHDFSFPSGHSANSFAVAWILLRMTKKRYGVPAVTLAALIALSRLYVGVHYPTDVLAGTAIAIVLAELTLHLLPKIEKKLFPKKRKKGARKGARKRAPAANR